MATGPLVSVLTPAYNVEAYLAECIESVFAQTYDHWELVIVDNASTDRTGEIAAKYAAADARIRVYGNPQLVPVITNHNIAARHMSPDAAYCKFLGGDDVLFPECLECMVAVAERHPSVGVVSSYRLQGDWVDLDGLPYPSPVVPGRTICRWSLLGFPYVFGAPTSHMIRAEFVRRRDPFYDESTLHADEAACYDVLQTADLGFVHQVLTFSRMHRDSGTMGLAWRLNTQLAGALKILRMYGPVYLNPAEYVAALDERLARYYKFLVQALVSGSGREVWDDHRRALRELGLPFSYGRFFLAALQHLRRVVMAPATELPKVLHLIRRHGIDETGWLAEEWREVLEAADHRAMVKWIERPDAARVLRTSIGPAGSAPATPGLPIARSL